MRYAGTGPIELPAGKDGGLNFNFICDHSPRLEYLFGCYLPRFASTSRVDPDRIIRRFALNKPNALADTVRELEEFLLFARRQSNPERICLRLLGLVDCPHPGHYQFDAFGWLQHVLTIFRQYSAPTNCELLNTAAIFTYESLNDPIERDTAADLPLNLPFILLRPTGALARTKLELSTAAKLESASRIVQTPIALTKPENTWVTTDENWAAGETLLDVPCFV